MTVYVQPNIVKYGTTTHGILTGYIFYLKEAMVASGRFEVRGSGDGDALYAYDGETAALDPGDQGSGGDFDCWKFANFDLISGPVAGRTNIKSWLVMHELGTDREYLFQATDQGAGGWDGYGRIAYNPGGGATPAFDGSAADADTIPDAATNEQFILGSRASANGANFASSNSASGWFHAFCDDTAENGATGFGLVFSNLATNPRSLTGFAVVPLVQTPAWETDPIIIMTAFDGTGANCFTFGQFGTVNQAWFTSVVMQNRSLYNDNASVRTSGKGVGRSLAVSIGAGADEYVKGYTGRTVLFTSRYEMPRMLESGDGRRYYVSHSGCAVRWSDADPLVLPR